MADKQVTVKVSVKPGDTSAIGRALTDATKQAAAGSVYRIKDEMIARPGTYGQPPTERMSAFPSAC